MDPIYPDADDENLCSECNEPFPEAGDGWDGKCPSCADRAENEQLMRQIAAVFTAKTALKNALVDLPTDLLDTVNLDRLEQIFDEQTAEVSNEYTALEAIAPVV